MSQYKQGQVKVLAATPNKWVLTGGVTTGNIAIGNLAKFQGENVFYTVASIVDATSFTTSANYSGAKAFDTFFDYAVVVDFTPTQSFPLLRPGDVDIRDVYSRALNSIDAMLAGHKTVAGYTELIQADVDGNIALGVRGKSLTQSADIFTVEKSDGTKLLRVTAAGAITVPAGTSTIPSLLFAGNGNGFSTPTSTRLDLILGSVSTYQFSNDSFLFTVAGTVNGTLKVLGSAGALAGQLYIRSAAAGTIGLVVDTAGNPSVNTIEWYYNGARSGFIVSQASDSGVQHDARSLGNNVAGPYYSTGRNTNGSAEGPAAGSVRFYQAGGTLSAVWADAAGKLRIHTASPTGSSGTPNVSDTAGTVVGDQTSWHEAKHLLGPSRIDPAEALSALLATRVYDFRYRDGSYNDRLFTGLVGLRRDDWFLKNTLPNQTPALDEVTVHGYEILAIQALHRRLEQLEMAVSTLRGGR